MIATPRSTTRTNRLETDRCTPLLTQLLILFLALLPSATATAQRQLKSAPFPDVTRELAEFEVDPELEVNLYAADPFIVKPIQIHFDARGRLWVASSGLYPHIKPGELPNDKIFILEDVDEDGRADNSTVFTDGLLMPTGIIPDGNDGAYVANSTDLLYFKDHDGDGKADEKHIVLSGFGIEDTHHILHTFRYGPGGALYFNQSIYIHSHIETPYGVRRLGGGGIWRFQPESLRLDVFVYGMCNGWGHHFDRWGQSFGADGAYGEGVIYFLPGARYVGTPSSERLMHGLNPGSPKHCGAELLSGRQLPEGWDGSFVTNDFRAHRVCRFVLSESGSGYVSRQVREPIKSKDIAFRPVDVKMGPDGALYIADWYNPIIQHGEVDFRSPLRNHANGRIWRLKAKERPALPRPTLVGARIEELLDALKAPEDWTRHHAKRVLSHRETNEVRKGLGRWLAHLDVNDASYEHHKLEALWTYQTIGVVEKDLLRDLLRGKDHRTRAAATRVLGYWQHELAAPLKLLATQVSDEHPRVRLEAVHALAKNPTAEAMALALTVLDAPMDHFLDYALHVAAKRLEPQWLAALENGSLDFRGKAHHLEFALRSVGSGRVVAQLIRLLGSDSVPKERRAALLEVVALNGDAKALDGVADSLATLPDDDARTTVLSALVRAARDRGVQPATQRAGVLKWLDDSARSSASRAAAARLAGLWKQQAARKSLQQLATRSDADTTTRAAAMHGLASLGGEESTLFLLKLAKDGPVATRIEATVALAGSQLQPAAGAAALVLAEASENDACDKLYTAFLTRKGGPEALASALGSAKISEDVAKIGLRLADTQRGTASAVVEPLQKAGGISEEPRSLAGEALERFIASVVADGDPKNGERIFRRSDTACLSCHSIGGAGGLVGPDLLSIGATAQLDYLVDSLLLPNKAIKENYHSKVFVTKDGRVLTGIKVRESGEEIVLRDVNDDEVLIRRSAIAQETDGGSLMPVGLTDSLTTGEFRDLVRFLSELGKIGPYSVGKTPTARRWRLRRPGESKWEPVYTRVDGRLPWDELTDGATSGRIELQLDVGVTKAGDVELRFNSAAGLQLRAGDTTLSVESGTRLKLAAGKHTLTLLVDVAQRREDILVELVEVAQGAHAQFVGGK